MKSRSAFPLCFALVLLLFCAALAWYLPTMNALRFQMDDVTLSLETSYGRERKQRMEYDQVVAELPEARARLAELQPQAEAAAAEVTALKETRKRLREEKKALEERLNSTAEAREGGNANE